VKHALEPAAQASVCGARDGEAAHRLGVDAVFVSHVLGVMMQAVEFLLFYF
jgi:hypothetical protein